MTTCATTSGRNARVPALVHRFSWVALSGFGRQVAFFIVNAYLAYCLSKQMFGTITLAFGVLMVFVGIADFGLRQVGWREIARNTNHISKVVNAVFTTRLLVTLIAFGGFMAVASIYCHNWRDWTIFFAYSFGLFFNMTSFDYPFLGRDKMDTLARAYAVSYAYFVPACLLTISSDATAWLVPVHFVIAHAILFALLYRNYRRSFGPLVLTLDRQTLTHYLREAWPLGINLFLFRATINYPVLLVGFMISSVAAAEYRLVEMCYALFTSLGLHLGSSTFTTLASHKKNEEQVSQNLTIAVEATMLSLVPAAFAFATILPTALSFLHLGNSPNVTMICWLLGITLPMAVVTRYLQTCLPGIGLSRELLNVNAISLAIGLTSGVVLVTISDVWGIAASVLLSESVVLFLLFKYLKQHVPALSLSAMFATPMLAAVITFSLYIAIASTGAPDWLSIATPITCSVPIAWRFSATRQLLTQRLHLEVATRQSLKTAHAENAPPRAA